jgi:hypothetical protein
VALITIFSAPKPFEEPHITTIQRNAVRSWVALGDDVEVLLLGEETGLAEAAAELGVRHIPQVHMNEHGTPLISSLFETARQASEGPLLAFVNTDILLMPDVVDAARQLLAQSEAFLMVGQRWDLEVTELLDLSAGWAERLGADLVQRGRLHPPGGSDYFIFPRECFTDIPDLAVGRAGWDNWMIYEARQRGWDCVDCTEVVRIIHQDHDYRHLPGGQPHYRLPETNENVRLGGGPRTIFTLHDASHRLVDGQLQRAALSGRKFWREVEIFPLVRLQSFLLANLLRRAYRELRAWLKR